MACCPYGHGARGPRVRGELSHRTRARLADRRRQDADLDGLLTDLARVGRVAIVGGAVRDWCYGRAPRDLDFVVDGPAAPVRRLLGDRSVARTRLGGYRFDRPRGVDVWALADTWTFALADATPSLRAMVRTPFLRIDGVAVALDDGEVFDGGFGETLATGVLGIGLPATLDPDRAAVRALVFAERYGLALAPDLAAFVDARRARGLDQAAVDRVVAALGYAERPDLARPRPTRPPRPW